MGGTRHQYIQAPLPAAISLLGRGRVQRHLIIYRDHSRTQPKRETKINPISYDPRRSRTVDISLTYR